jgi:alginate O-acetyltransferase complex protein AlgI
MIFSTPAFLFLFLPPVLLIGWLLKKEAQNFFLLLASLVFYAWGEGWVVLLLLGSALFNHGLGLAIDKIRSPRKRKITLIAGLGSNLALLIVFKYAGFILANLEPLLGIADHAGGNPIAWHQPLGISFFTFMAMAYLVEVYNRAYPAERNFLHTALFITFFPTVLAGPINRYSRLRQQMTERETTPELLAQGVRRFIIGLGKKVLLADTLGKMADQIFAIPVSGLTAGVSWLGAAYYTLQIFLDFSGYSDMAIGLGRMFGFTFMENFNYPYISRSITEFWTRWHISLSTWLRDFIFLPVAYSLSRRIKGDRWLGIRADSWCYYPAMLVTMLLCGIWHGAAWTFIAWGGYLGLFIMLERFALKKFLKRLWPPLQIAYALLAAGFGWVLFRSRDFSQAAAFWRSMLGSAAGDGREFHAALYLDRRLVFFLAAGLLAAFPVFPALRAGFETLSAGAKLGWLRSGGRLLTVVFLAAVLLASAMAMAAVTFNPFIYFRF